MTMRLNNIRCADTHSGTLRAWTAGRLLDTLRMEQPILVLCAIADGKPLCTFSGIARKQATDDQGDTLRLSL
ncbi:hypothetical protein MPLSOD_130155 [Mesorhizobium sp. SOD10]|nr:hypothetical protein MPLSOD_130155 [Mesorhizobium sp. SOD10]